MHRRSSDRRPAVLLLTLLAAACAGDGDDRPADSADAAEADGTAEAKVAEIAPVGSSTVQGEATASSRRGAVKVSLAIHGLAEGSALRVALHDDRCPTDVPAEGDAVDDDESEGSPQEGQPSGGSAPDALAWTRISPGDQSAAATLTFPAADLPAGGNVSIVVRDPFGAALACGRVTGLPVTEAPDGVEVPRTGEDPPAGGSGGDGGDADELPESRSGVSA